MIIFWENFFFNSLCLILKMVRVKLQKLLSVWVSLIKKHWVSHQKYSKSYPQLFWSYFWLILKSINPQSSHKLGQNAILYWLIQNLKQLCSNCSGCARPDKKILDTRSAHLLESIHVIKCISRKCFSVSQRFLGLLLLLFLQYNEMEQDHHQYQILQN